MRDGKEIQKRRTITSFIDNHSHPILAPLFQHHFSKFGCSLTAETLKLQLIRPEPTNLETGSLFVEAEGQHKRSPWFKTVFD
jgi:hypothetical protein